MSDRYDEAVEFLTEHPEKIQHAWFDPQHNLGGALFLYATPTGRVELKDPEFKEVGCLTQIHGRYCVPAKITPLLQEIIDDERIPSDSGDITVESLPVFAEWQRRLDKEIRNV